MQFIQKYIYLPSKNRQIRYIFTILLQTFCLFILFIFFIFIHKKSHLTNENFLYIFIRQTASPPDVLYPFYAQPPCGYSQFRQKTFLI